MALFYLCYSGSFILVAQSKRCLLTKSLKTCNGLGYSLLNNRKRNFVLHFSRQFTSSMDKFLIKKRKGDESETTPKKVKTSESSEESVDVKKTGKQEEDAESDSFTNSVFPGNATIKELLGAIPDSDKEAQEYSLKLADFLLNEVVLVANNKKIALREVEFYWTTDGHNDPFTHKSQIQQTTANWYFHKTGNNYRSGTYKGLDISIGRDDKHVGGFLIRSIEALDGSGDFVCGPSLSVDRLLECCKTSSVPDMVDNLLKGNLSVDKNDTLPAEKFRKKDDDKKNFTKILYLERIKRNSTVLRELPVFSSPRVGLYMTKANVKLELQASYVYRNYRYFSKPKNIPKGRFSMICAFHAQGKSVDEIVRLTGSKAATVSKYIESYNSGKKSKDSFARKLSDDEVCQAMGALAARAKAGVSVESEEEESPKKKETKKKKKKDESSEEEEDDE